MIHTLFVTVDTSPETLKKEFRKRLMTGGCVIRLSTELTAADCQQILDRFLPHYYPNSAAAEVLRQLAQRATEAPDLRASLIALNDRAISEALSEGSRSMHGA